MQPAFIPLWPESPDDRYATRAVAEALYHINHLGSRRGKEKFKLDVGGIDIVRDGHKADTDDLQAQIDLIKKRCFRQTLRPVFFTHGVTAIQQIKNIDAIKFVTSHLGPDRLIETINEHFEQSDLDRIKEVLSIDALAAPSYTLQHMDADCSHVAQQNPDILWAKSVPVCAIDDVYYQHPETVRYLHKAINTNCFAIIGADQKHTDFFQKMEKQKADMGYHALTLASEESDFGHVLSLIRANPASKILLQDESPVMLAQTMQTLAADQILVHLATLKTQEHKTIIRHFHETMGSLTLLNDDGSETCPASRAEPFICAAREIADAMICRYSQDLRPWEKFQPFERPSYLKQSI